MPRSAEQCEGDRALHLRRSASAVYHHAQGRGFYGASDKSEIKRTEVSVICVLHLCVKTVQCINTLNKGVQNERRK